MIAEVITIGDEILIGQVIDSNSAWIAQNLNQIGINLHQITSVSDNKEHIIKVLDESSNNADIVLITGGLGPTKDDITKKTLAYYFNSELVIDEMVIKQLEVFAKNRGVELSQLNKKQAEVPSNCIVIDNPHGTAPGMWFEKDNTIFISMPGVPYEMRTMMENKIIPRIKQKFKTPNIIHKTILTHGIAEAHLAVLLREWGKKLPQNLKLAY